MQRMLYNHLRLFSKSHYFTALEIFDLLTMVRFLGVKLMLSPNESPMFAVGRKSDLHEGCDVDVKDTEQDKIFPAAANDMVSFVC